jgi:transcriptional regulator with XRE-family HTH domain
VAETSETLGERLARLRSERRLSIAQVARAARTTEGTIRHLESGRSKGPALMTGLRLAKTLGVSAWYIAAGRDGDPEEMGSRSLERRVEELERRAHETAALDLRVSRLEARAAADPQRTAPESQ